MTQLRFPALLLKKAGAGGGATPSANYFPVSAPSVTQARADPAAPMFAAWIPTSRSERSVIQLDSRSRDAAPQEQVADHHWLAAGRRRIVDSQLHSGYCSGSLNRDRRRVFAFHRIESVARTYALIGP